MRGHLVYVSGAPGAGKTSLAVPLAAELGYSLVTKDMIKETLHDVLCTADYGEPDRAWARRLGASAMELLCMTLGRGAGGLASFDFHRGTKSPIVTCRAAFGQDVSKCEVSPPQIRHESSNDRTSSPSGEGRGMTRNGRWQGR